MKKGTAIALGMGAWLMAGAALWARAQTHAQNDPAVTALLAKAVAASDIEAEGAPAFRLEARMRVQLGQGRSEDGKLLWIWTPAGWSHDEMALADYQSLEIAAGDQLWLKSSANYLPFPLYITEQALNVWDWPRQAGDEHLGGPEISASSGETCVATKATKGGSDSQRYCFDTLSGNLASVADSEWNVTIRYSEYAPFGRRSFPRRMEVERNGDEPFLEIRVVQLVAEAQTDLRLFLPVEGARPMPTEAACGEIEPAKLEKMVQPTFPKGAQEAGVTGLVRLYAEVGPDGIPRGMWPLNSAPPILVNAAIDAVSLWRYRPRTCKGSGTTLRQVEELSLEFTSH